MQFTSEQISKFLYGYNQIKCLSTDEVLEALKRDQLLNEDRNSPPLSPRKLRVPDEISLCLSSLPGDKFGACAVKRISHGTWFGPFEGKLVRTTELKPGLNSEHMWEIYHDGEVSHYLDGCHENTWMTFVRCARHKKEQNLVVFQYHGCIYYRTTRDIQPGAELLVWYDNKYTQILGIPVAWNDNRNTTSKRKSSISTDDTAKKRKEKTSPVLLLQKIDTKLHSPKQPANMYGNRKKSRSPAALPPPVMTPLKCDKCFFSFHTKEQLSTHKCLNQQQPWPTTLRLPSLDRSRDFLRPMHIKMPSMSELNAYYHAYHTPYSPLQNLHYHSPPMDPLKNLPSAPHKGAPIAIRNF